MSWPKGADGDVFRRLQSAKFDFSSPHEIDFNVDFLDWPPSEKAIHWLENEYGAISIHEPSADFNGYLQFQIKAKVNYDLVVSTQQRVTAALENFGGVCKSWGVLQAPPH